MINYIYGLYEIGKEEIKYIGKTNNIDKRLKEHIKDSLKNNSTPKQKWIKSIIDSGSNIDIKILKKVGDNWENEEIDMISSYKNLTNVSKGEFGGKGFTYTIDYCDCKDIIKDLELKSIRQWRIYSNLLPEFIPKNPSETYKNRGWISWGDFLGTGRKQDNLLSIDYVSYDDAKEWIKSNYNNINTIKEWKKVKKELPIFIPKRPERYYINKNRGWISWGDFLGTGRIANRNKKFISYQESSNFAKSNNIISRTQWYKFQLPSNIPSNPDKEYDVWISWGEFLGTGRKQDNILSNDYLLYDDAKEYIKNNLSYIKNGTEYLNIGKNGNIPNILPNHPELYYIRKNRGWKGWKDFLTK